LRADHQFACRVLEELLPGAKADGELSVEVEQRVRLADNRFGRIDLALRARDAVVWFEVKLDSPWSGEDQLDKYLETLAGDRSTVRALVVLAPARGYAKLVRQDGTPLPLAAMRDPQASAGLGPWFVSWQDVGRAVEAARVGATAPHVGWLADEFLTFLYEQGLRSMPLTTEHLAALRAIAEAENALYNLVEQTIDAIDERWALVTQRVPTLRDGYLELLYQAPEADAKYGWGIHRDEVFAGVVFEGDDAPESLMALDALLGWESDARQGWAWHTKPLSEVTTASPQAQSKELALFVNKTFEALATRLV
jgi:hypothetical protein